MPVRGVVTHVAWEPRGTELMADVAQGATELTVEWAGMFDTAGGQLDLDGQTLTYTGASEDEDPEQQITLDPATPAPAATEGTRIYAMAGGQILTDHIAYVGTDDEGDESAITIPYAQRDAWPEGSYDDPIPVWLTDDYAELVEVDGRTPTRTLRTALEGQRVVIRNDEETGGGIVEFYSGLEDEETPATLDPYAGDWAGRPGLTLSSGMTSTHQDRGELEIITQAGGDGTQRNGHVNVHADTFGIWGRTTTMGPVLVQFGDLDVTGGVVRGANGLETGTLDAPSGPGGIRSEGNITTDRGNIFCTTGFGRFKELEMHNPPETTDAANVSHAGWNGRLRRVTSTRRNKTNIEPDHMDPERLLALEPKTYTSLCAEDDPETLHAGFIAEEADELGLETWVRYDDAGTPQSFNYDRWVTALQRIARHQAERITDLEARLAALEERVTG